MDKSRRAETDDRAIKQTGPERNEELQTEKDKCRQTDWQIQDQTHTDGRGTDRQTDRHVSQTDTY